MAARLIRLQFIMACLLGVLALRLVHLQVIRGGHYRSLAERNRLRVVPQPAPRGLILDRRGRVLASTQTLFRVALIPQELDDLAGLLARLGPILRRSPETLHRTFLKERTYAFVPVTVASHVPKEIALQLEEERWRLPGLLVQAEAARHYPLGSTAAQLLGYLSQPTEEELPRLKPYGVQPKHLVGRAGLERFLDADLRGRPGGMVVEVNHRGRQIRLIGQRPSQPGERVTLTLDAALQSLIEQSFAAQPGAAVVLNPWTGAVLAMASTPTFSPEAFAVQDTPQVQALLTDEVNRPLVNRATLAAYQPGSIAKLATAAAALNYHVITPSTAIPCGGELTIGDRVFHCWNRDGHGPLNLSEALLHSCNVYFMTLGRWVRKDRLVAALAQAGWGRKTGWALGEQAGHLPSRRLTEGEMALLAIGQGELLATPLQVAVTAAAFATQGSLVQPWVVGSVGSRTLDGSTATRRVHWPAETFEAVRAGMIEVVRHPEGTGRRAFTPAISIAGKTGTAQTHIPDKTHAWFIGFCPVDHPRLAFAVMAEYGGSGGDLPAEIARAACEYAAATTPNPEP
ncbi:MAG: penicillin-binding protein 2 [Candidatus Omnitrophica bacterium]|nr:penicillin-binding protein 2 [Candidatus Omnitrophota bacterium]